MTFDNQKSKRKKKDQSVIEKELLAILRSSLKACLDQALNEILKDFNK